MIARESNIFYKYIFDMNFYTLAHLYTNMNMHLNLELYDNYTFMLIISYYTNFKIHSDQLAKILLSAFHDGLLATRKVFFFCCQFK